MVYIGLGFIGLYGFIRLHMEGSKPHRHFEALGFSPVYGLVLGMAWELLWASMDCCMGFRVEKGPCSRLPASLEET